MHDLLLKNGTLIDPTTKLHRVGDLAITGSLITEVLGKDSAATASRVLDVSGLIVTSGFIDLHVHVFSGVTHYGIDVDPTCLGRGVTTAVDAGSAGALTFAGFRKFIIDVAQTRLFALLNISENESGFKLISPRFGLAKRVGQFECAFHHFSDDNVGDRAGLERADLGFHFQELSWNRGHSANQNSHDAKEFWRIPLPEN